ncbi:MAG: GspH/FimT family pseudopilin [Hylemonella sp.]|uniref:GspH/FimT family pseudopilin n=1 Tax=Hylemonella sp. TaxID=2066020 RepID=UPI0022CB4BA4|nr:GspH/FimT family pseudopilin [Hylemonella sp.]MCZ8251916.1 GspH/FimT family pseudopilin [Hylemonella sp.]
MNSDILSPGCRPSMRWSRLQNGFNLIELMVGVSVMALILYFMIPSMGAWMQSSQIRSATESIQGALQLARAEAVQRNTNVELVLTSVAGGGNSTDWLVRCVTPSATCPGTGQVETFIQQRVAREGSPNATVTLNPAMSTIVFSGTGRITPLPAGNITINVGHQKANSCLTDGGDFRCLRLILAPGGQMRMCDPAVTAPNPRAC